jgi:farnesyl-diphosphate farnesyltransferase
MTVQEEQDRPATGQAADAQFLHDLLEKTSRTFALSIPELPEPTMREVTIAYLLFRIADTFEDATVLWDRPKRFETLHQFAQLLRDPNVERSRELTASWVAQPPIDHDGYLELLEKTPEVIAALLTLSQPAQAAICHHTIRTSELMATFVDKTDDDGVLQLEGLGRLRDYCYAVAGIVGEMLTELFLLDRDNLTPVGEYLRERAALFGEGLQLVNILKDSATDATEGRNYLPEGVDRAEVFALARTDLEAAAQYCVAIQESGGPDGVVAFTALPVELAWATLDKVERKGPGSKISRAEVFLLHKRMHRAIDKGRPVLASVTS